MSRRFKQKTRGNASKRKRSTVFIAAEGHNRTERNYFKGFIARHKNLALRMVPDSSTDPVRMAESLGDFMEESGFSSLDGDLAFCLIDHDCNHAKDDQIRQALKIAQDRGFHIILSNPCFELWFICHFTSTPKNYASSKEVLKDIIHYLPGYGKSDEDLFMRTESHLPEAIENAKKLEKRCLESGYTLHGYGFSPSTEVYRMTELMMAVNSR